MDNYQLDGALAFSSINNVWPALRTAIKQCENETFCIDLSNVTRSDSAGLAMMVEALRLASDRGIRLQLMHMPEQLRALAQFCRLDDILSQFEVA